uniref:Uncharacterized protein n=1 Tax=Ditylenchus dipsaci TaxID=166011 RepID=A0A915DM89_9BILA
MIKRQDTEYSQIYGRDFIIGWDKSELSDSGSGKLVYRGKYDKDKWLMALLIQHGKFKPEELIFTHVLDAKAPSSKDEELSGKSAMECLSLLCKLNDGGLSLTNYAGPELLLKLFEAAANVNLLGDLDKLLGLNAVKTRLIISFNNFRCLPETVNFSTIRSPRIETVELVFNSGWHEVEDEEFYASEWLKLLSYVVTSCPNLKNLEVKVNMQAMRAMMDLVLSQITAEDCFIRVQFNSYIDVYYLEELESSDHELFLVGVRKPGIDDTDICREVPFGNTAELSFRISAFVDGSLTDREEFDGDYAIDYYDDYFEEYASSGIEELEDQYFRRHFD